MASLSAHLREPGDHGALAFHPACPVCREERLAGTLRADALVGRRGQALFAAGVLALSATPATAALAQEPDQEQEGAAAPDSAGAVADPASDPDFDPGGESTDLPFDGGPTTDAPDAAEPDDETGAVEQEPTTNEDAPIADAGDGTSTAAEQPTPTAETPPPPAPTPDPAEPAPAADAPSATPVPTEPEADTRPDARDDARKQSRRHADHQSANVPAPAPAPAARRDRERATSSNDGLRLRRSRPRHARPAPRTAAAHGPATVRMSCGRASRCG